MRIILKPFLLTFFILAVSVLVLASSLRTGTLAPQHEFSEQDANRQYEKLMTHFKNIASSYFIFTMPASSKQACFKRCHSGMLNCKVHVLSRFQSMCFTLMRVCNQYCAEDYRIAAGVVQASPVQAASTVMP